MNIVLARWMGRCVVCCFVMMTFGCVVNIIGNPRSSGIMGRLARGVQHISNLIKSVVSPTCILFFIGPILFSIHACWINFEMT